MSQNDSEFNRRLTNLENAERNLSNAVNELITETKLVAQATNSMQRTLEKLGDVYDKFSAQEHKYDTALKELDFKYAKQVQLLSEEISKNKDFRDGYNRIKWGVIMSFIGLAVTAVIGSSGWQS